MRASFAKDLLSESSIIGNQNASVDLGNLYHFIIVNSTCLTINREYVMTLLFQPKCDRRTGTLIDQKLHLCVLHLKRYEGRVLKSLRGKKKTCLNIFFSHSVVFISNVGCGRSMREQIKNVVYW